MRKFAVIFACCLVITLTGAQQNGDLRLQDGPDSESGRVEIYLNQQWGTLDAGTTDSEQMGAAQTICRQLGYESSSYYGTVPTLGWPTANDSVPMLLEDVRCIYNILDASASQHILRCDYSYGTSPPNHQNDFGVSCNPTLFPYDTQVQLVQGNTGYSSSGFVQIYLLGSWGPVCNMGPNDADTACRQLGYTESSGHGSSDAYDLGGPDQVSYFFCSTSQPCLRNCFSYNSFSTCGILYSYVNCTFTESKKGQYGSGDQTVCSLRGYITLAVGVAVAVLVLILLCIIGCSVMCCCLIPGCLIHSSRRKTTYETIY